MELSIGTQGRKDLKGSQIWVDEKVAVDMVSNLDWNRFREVALQLRRCYELGSIDLALRKELVADCRCLLRSQLSYFCGRSYLFRHGGRRGAIQHGVSPEQVFKNQG